jgi:hypothetical protein
MTHFIAGEEQRFEPALIPQLGATAAAKEYIKPLAKENAHALPVMYITGLLRLRRMYEVSYNTTITLLLGRLSPALLDAKTQYSNSLPRSCSVMVISGGNKCS